MLAALFLTASPALAPAPAAPSPAAPPAAVPASDSAGSDLAQKWGLDFSQLVACQEKEASGGVEGFAQSFNYEKVPRQGTLMSALGLAASIARLSCLVDGRDPRFHFSRFYCGALPYLFQVDPKSKTKAAVQKERLATRDFVKKFGAATRAERRELVQAVIAQFEKCGRQEELRRLATVMYLELDEYETTAAKASQQCPPGCDPRSKPDWGLTRTNTASGMTRASSTEKCFTGCNAEPELASLATKFIHRRVLQGISVEEMRDWAGMLPGSPALAKNEVGLPGSNLHWLRCAVGQTWQGDECSGTATALVPESASKACPVGYRLPRRAELEALFRASPQPSSSTAGGQNAPPSPAASVGCRKAPACSSLFGEDERTFWARESAHPWPQDSANFRTGVLATPKERTPAGKESNVSEERLMVRCVRSGLAVPPPVPATAFKQVPGAWLQVSAGGSGTSGGHTCGINAADRALYCWGANANGALGDGTRADRNVPTKVGTGTWTAVSAGGNHSCAINSAGQLHCWGYNSSGQLGEGSLAEADVPTPVREHPLAKAPIGAWLQVDAGQNHTCGINADHKLYCWGANGSGQAGEGSYSEKQYAGALGNDTWSAVSLAKDHTCGIKMADGKLYCWGANDAGQLGIGAAKAGSAPAAVGDEKWLKVASGGEYGDSFSCGIKLSDRKLYCWGGNTSGQLGIGTLAGEKAPVKVSDDSWAEIAAGADFACGLKADGKLFCWGSNKFGRLGDGTATLVARSYSLLENHDQPIPTSAGDETWSALSAGNKHACAIRASDKSLFCWGANDRGQLGVGAAGGAQKP